MDAYNEFGVDGLEPKGRAPEHNVIVSKEILAEAIRLRREVPSRSVPTIIQIALIVYTVLFSKACGFALTSYCITVSYIVFDIIMWSAFTESICLRYIPLPYPVLDNFWSTKLYEAARNQTNKLLAIFS